jgi:DeoR family suf operon transcriptional repressor
MDDSRNYQQQDTRIRILHLLKVGGPKTVRQLANLLGISLMGVRQHLVFLEGAGWIRHHQEQRGLGRPQFIYRLTEQGDEEQFPRAYAAEMVGLLKAIGELDGAAGLNKVFEQRTEQLVAEYRERISSKDLEVQVKALASIRTEEGFMAGWEKENEDSFLLWEHNCAIYKVVRHCDQACICEHVLFSRVLDGAEVRRTSHILAGDPKCTYLIRRRR